MDWTGQDVICVGGGPSLAGFPWGALRGRTWVGCNMAFLHDPTTTIARDSRWAARYWKDPRYLGATCERFVLGTVQSHGAPPTGVLLLEPAPRWTRAVHEGLFRGGDTGLAALNLADARNAKRVYLLGYDYDGNGRDRTSNYHNEYPPEWSASWKVYRRFLDWYDKILVDIRAEVYNLNPKSRLRAFPFADVREVLGCDPW